jgi:hypothetical protein
MSLRRSSCYLGRHQLSIAAAVGEREGRSRVSPANEVLAIASSPRFSARMGHVVSRGSSNVGSPCLSLKRRARWMKRGTWTLNGPWKFSANS